MIRAITGSTRFRWRNAAAAHDGVNVVILVCAAMAMPMQIVTHNHRYSQRWG
jgi:hypothetical protein